METAITTQTTLGGFVPSIGSVGGAVWQSEVSTVTVDGAVKFQIVDGTSYLLTSHGRADVSEDVPAGLDHAGTVAFWVATVQRWERERSYLCRGDVFVTNDGQTVEASGFQSVEQLQAFAIRAKRGGLRTWPSGPGVVLVSSSRGDARYAVTRTSCECRGHQSHGRCMHRALAVHLADVEGVPVCRVATIGANAAGVTMLPGALPAVAEAA